MPSTVVTLLSAAAGGLIGSIGGPLLKQYFDKLYIDRWQRRQVRGEERNRELREMVEKKIRKVKRFQNTCNDLILSASSATAPEIRDQLLAELSMQRDQEWEPDLIADNKLRVLAALLGLHEVELLVQLKSIPNTGEACPDNWFDEWIAATQEISRETDSVYAEFRQGMDRAGW